YGDAGAHSKVPAALRERQGPRCPAGEGDGDLRRSYESREPKLAAGAACLALPVGVEGATPHPARAWYRPWETSSRPSPWRLSGVHRLVPSRPTIFASQRNGEPRQADSP